MARTARSSKLHSDHRRRRVATIVACGSLAAGGLGGLVVGGPVLAAPARTAVPAASGVQPAIPGPHDVVANLFEWNWPSVASECVHVLGPSGYGAVQVAPPQDSLKRTSLGNGSNTVLHPWWEVYQPIDYSLFSRMGTETQFKSMVATCRKAGVQVIVDAVINHASGQGNLSYGGVHYSKYSYPNYDYDDFHHYPSDCPEPDGTIHDFNNYLEVTQCELVGLADLRTQVPEVRTTIANYLNKLLGYGVSGFRVDAAKHIGQVDLGAIERLLHNTVDGTRPYIAQEVAPGGPGKLTMQAYEVDGSLLGFDFASQIEAAFKSYTTTPEGAGNITDLSVFGTDAGLLPSNKTLVFVENHDTERNGSTLSYKDGPTNLLANEFMLARGYGRPEVYSSFTFNTPDDSPPSNAQGFITNTVCGAAWTCIDALPSIRHMVRWHNVAGVASVANWWDDGLNLISFSRGSLAWIALNNEATARTHTFHTGLPAGRYCDVISGGAKAGGGCTGPTVTVNSSGDATVTVPAKDAVAIDVVN